MKATNEVFASATFWGGAIAGLGFGFYIGYAVHQDGLLTVPDLCLVLPTIALILIGQQVARWGFRTKADPPADKTGSP